MALENLTPSEGSTHRTKRIGRGQGSGMGKTATRGGKGQTARSGYTAKRGFEGGQQPLQRRLPKIGFNSKVEKPYVINVDRVTAVATLGEISLESIKTVMKLPNYVVKVKLIGTKAKELASKIKDEAVLTSGKVNG
jgi:large subunit ribosomal protein L15